MKVPYFEAKDAETGRVVRGFYFEYPATTYCFSNDYEKSPVELIPCIIFDQMTDFGLPNRPMICSPIDRSTLKQIGWIETDRNIYSPDTWIEKM